MNGLDRANLERILRKHEEDDSILILNMRHYQACEKGDNFMSVVMKAKVDGKRVINGYFTDFTMSLIVKLPFESEVLRTAFDSSSFFENEIIAYNILIPKLKENYGLSLPVPRCIHASSDFIILEDLNIRGYEMQRDVSVLNINQTLIVLQELALFHGASIVLKHTNKEGIANLSTKIKEAFRPDNKYIIDLIDKNISVTLTLLEKSEQTEEVIETIKKLENNKNKIYEKVANLFQSERKVSVFNHGDCWRNNILFTNSGNLKVKLIDLQLMRYTSVAADLNYFLYINLMPEERLRNLDLYIDTYLNALHRVLLENNIDVDYQLYSKEWLEKEMEDFSIFGFMAALWISPAFYFKKEALPDMETITEEQMKTENHKDFILSNMTPGLQDRLCSLAINFIRNYKFE